MPGVCLVVFVFLLLIAAAVYVFVPPVYAARMVEESAPGSTTTAADTTAATSTAPAATAEPSDPLLIQTQYGRVRGTWSNGVRVFHGVPYARPPTGDLRWKPPTDPEPWAPTTLDATELRPGCPQDCKVRLYCPEKMSEDCLYLEIYVPSNVTDLLPVMVNIHGGSFKDVSATLPIYNATKLVKRTGLIVVLMEYRIGTLGFLLTGTGEDQITGNYGLLDQIHALKWVRANIKAFGGDPDKVTLVGQSAGAQSALILLDSAEASPYFQRLIVESPPLTLPFNTMEAASKHGRTFARILECANESSNINITCLRSKPVQSIIEAQGEATNKGFRTVELLQPWSPVIDGKTVTAQVYDAMKRYAETNHQRKPIICGHMTEEGVTFIGSIFTFPVNRNLFEIILGQFLRYVPPGLDKMYSLSNESDVRDDLAQLATDLIFRCPLRSVATTFSKGNDNVWFYSWGKPIGIELPEEYKYSVNRAGHNTEIPYIFNSFDEISNSTGEKDRQLSFIMEDYYANFVKGGDPNGGGLGDSRGSQLSRWPGLTVNGSTGLTYLSIQVNGDVTVTTETDNPVCDFWDHTNYSVVLGEREKDKN